MPKIADFPYTNAQILDLAKQFPTPFHLYHEETIRNTVKALNKAFSWCPGYKNHFAVKATPNPHIMQILKEEGKEWSVAAGVARTGGDMHMTEKFM